MFYSAITTLNGDYDQVKTLLFENDFAPIVNSPLYTGNMCRIRAIYLTKQALGFNPMNRDSYFINYDKMSRAVKEAE